MYRLILLTFTTGLIFTVLGNSNSTMLANIIVFTLYSSINCSVSFLDHLPAICYLRSLVLSSTKSSTLYPTASTLCLFTYHFMSFCALASTTLASSWTSSIFFVNCFISLYFVMNALDPIEELYDLYSDKEETLL